MHFYVSTYSETSFEARVSSLFFNFCSDASITAHHHHTWSKFLFTTPINLKKRLLCLPRFHLLFSNKICRPFSFSTCRSATNSSSCPVFWTKSLGFVPHSDWTFYFYCVNYTDDIDCKLEWKQEQICSGSARRTTCANVGLRRRDPGEGTDNLKFFWKLEKPTFHTSWIRKNQREIDTTNRPGNGAFISCISHFSHLISFKFFCHGRFEFCFESAKNWRFGTHN